MYLLNKFSRPDQRSIDRTVSLPGSKLTDLTKQLKKFEDKKRMGKAIVLEMGSKDISYMQYALLQD